MADDEMVKTRSGRAMEPDGLTRQFSTGITAVPPMPVARSGQYVPRTYKVCTPTPNALAPLPCYSSLRSATSRRAPLCHLPDAAAAAR